jgi:hypothetical protein
VTKKLSAREKRLKAQIKRLKAERAAARAEAKRLRSPKYVKLSKPRQKLTEAQKAHRASRTKLIPQLKRLTTEKQLSTFDIETAARWTERKPETVKRWVRKGNTPPQALDKIRAHLTGAKPLPESWKHGRQTRITMEEQENLHRTLRGFIQATHRKEKNTPKKYEEWRAEKKKIRTKLTKKAWDNLMKKLGKREGLQQEGLFSILRFMLS